MLFGSEQVLCLPKLQQALVHSVSRLNQSRADERPGEGLPPQEDYALDLSTPFELLVGNWEFGAGCTLRKLIDGLGVAAESEILLPPSKATVTALLATETTLSHSSHSRVHFVLDDILSGLGCLLYSYATSS